MLLFRSSIAEMPADKKMPLQPCQVAGAAEGRNRLAVVTAAAGMSTTTRVSAATSAVRTTTTAATVG